MRKRPKLLSECCRGCLNFRISENYGKAHSNRFIRAIASGTNYFIAVAKRTRGMSEPTCEEKSGHGGQCAGRDNEIAQGNELVVGLGLGDCNGACASSVLVHLQNLTSSLA